MATRRERRSGRVSAAAGVLAAVVIALLALFWASNRPQSQPSAAGVTATAGAPPEPGMPNAAASAGGACPVPSTVAPGQIADTLTREQAIQIATASVGGKVDAVRAQLMTLNDYIKGAGNEPVPGKGPHFGAVAGDDLVWVVTMSGPFGSAAPGNVDSWAVVIIDAVTGAVVGQEVRPSEPAFFSDLPDQTRHERPSC